MLRLIGVQSLVERYSWCALYRSCNWLAAYHCIEEDNFECKLQALPDLLIAFWSIGSRCSLSSSVLFTVYVVCCHCLCTCMFVVAMLTTLPSLCYFRGCLLQSSCQWILISVLQRSFGGKSFSVRICSHLLCFLFCVICMGNCWWFTDRKHCFTDNEL